jgi:hypothetical protein
MSDDEEPNVFYRDARDGLLTSAADKQRKALKHFDYFLKGYCTQIGIEAVEAKDIPYSGIPHGARNKTTEWWDACIGMFVTYMGSHATTKAAKYCSLTNPCSHNCPCAQRWCHFTGRRQSGDTCHGQKVSL